MDENDITIHPTSYDILLDDESSDQTYIGLRLNLTDGSTVTVPMVEQTAQQVGRLLCAHSDYVAQRPPRNW